MAGTVSALKAQLKELASKRAAIEADVQQRSERLNQPGMPGLKGSLLDKEGFPRADIDVAAVRTDRHAIICMSNDLKRLTDQMQDLLHQLHAAARSESTAGAANGGADTLNRSSSGGQPMDTDQQQPPSAGTAPAAPPQARPASGSAPSAPANGAANGAPPATASGTPAAACRPFAVVDEVSEGSPASSAGIQLGDQMCRFGDVAGGSGGELQRVAAVLAASQGQQVQALVLRRGMPVPLTLVPQPWAGRGLLGCHLRPL